MSDDAHGFTTATHTSIHWIPPIRNGDVAFTVTVDTVLAERQLRRVLNLFNTLDRQRRGHNPPPGCGWRHRKGQATR